MYVYIYIYIYVCTYVHTHTYTLYLSLSIYIYIYVCICMYIYIYIYMCHAPDSRRGGINIWEDIIDFMHHHLLEAILKAEAAPESRQQPLYTTSWKRS